MDRLSPIRFGRFEVRPAQRRLLADGRPAVLGARAFDLLQALIERRDRLVGKSELLDVVWPGVVVEEGNLHVQVSALRKVLGDAAIATVPGRGYRFVGDVEGEPNAANGDSPAPASGGNATPFGRETELAALRSSLQPGSATSLVGPAGIGKTCLARAIADEASRDGRPVVWLDCAPFDGDDAAAAVAAALGVPRDAVADRAALARALGSRGGLVVVDNVDRAAAPVAAIAAVWPATRDAPALLLTSPAPLGFAGERLLRVGPLPIPADDATANETDAVVRLLVETARRVDPRFGLAPGDLALACAIGRRLDGWPLAIELAAARAPLLGLRAVAERLDDRFRLLVRAPRGTVPRHPTLQAALDWSVSLLSSVEAAVLRRLGVFTGGFSLALAETVAADDAGIDRWNVLDALDVLADRSLVVTERPQGTPADGAVRYRLLETVREHALAALAAAGETEALRDRHARALAALAVAVDAAAWDDPPSHDGTGRGAMAKPPDPGPDLDNARSALRWALERGWGAVAVDLGGRLAPHAHARGLLHLWMPSMRAALAHVDAASPTGRVTLWWRLGQMGRQEGLALDDVHRYKVAAVAEARTAGLRRRLVPALASLAWAEAERGDEATALAHAAEMHALLAHDDPIALQTLPGMVEMKLHERRGDWRAARAVLLRERVRLLGVQGSVERDTLLSTLEGNLALFHLELGDHAAAEALLRESLARPTRSRRMTLHVYLMVHALVGADRLAEALDVARAHRADLEAHAATVLLNGREALAALASARGRLELAWRILGPSARRAPGDPPRLLIDPLLRALQEATHRHGIAPADVARWTDDGAALGPLAALAAAVD